MSPNELYRLGEESPVASSRSLIDVPACPRCAKHANGLQRMTQEARAEPPEIPEAHRKEILRLFSALTPQKQVIGFALLRELMTRSIPK